MLLLIGMAFGQSGFDLLPGSVTEWFEPLSVVALTMVAFLLGGELTRENLARNGRAIITISLSVVAVTCVLVTLGLFLIGVPFGLALLLGAIATATAPAAITDVIRQSGIRNAFTQTLSGIVAIDDVWGLIVFSLCLALVQASGDWSGPLVHAIRDLGGAVLIGGLIGIPAAFLTGRLKEGEPQQTEAIGVVFLTAGLSLWAGSSFLVAGMTAGIIIANFARHHDYSFHEIEHIEWPFMLLFFLLAGASFEIAALWSIGGIALAYIALRIAARILAAEIGERIGNVPRHQRHAFGPALLPQAGVAVGMALVAGEILHDWASQIMTLTIAATVFFELIGPPVTLSAIRRVTAAEKHDETAKPAPDE
jgi:Kef-type K+ transport system membrane component KefB